MKRIQVPAVMVTGLTTEKVENVRIVLLTTVKAGIVRIARDLMPTMKEANARNVLTTAKVVLMTVLNVLLTTVKVVLMTVLNVPVSIAAKVVSVRLMATVLNVLLTTVKVATVLNVLLTTVKVVTVRIVPVSITAKVAAIAAITAVGEVTVRDTTMTVHKEAIVLVRVPAIMIRMLSIA